MLVEYMYIVVIIIYYILYIQINYTIIIKSTIYLFQEKLLLLLQQRYSLIMFNSTIEVTVDLENAKTITIFFSFNLFFGRKEMVKFRTRIVVSMTQCSEEWINIREISNRFGRKENGSKGI